MSDKSKMCGRQKIFEDCQLGIRRLPLKTLPESAYLHG
eukprot:UN06477